MNFIIFPLTYRMQIFNNFTTNFVVMTIPPAMLQCRFNSSSNKPQSNQRKWWKCLVSTLKLMKIQFLFPSNRQMSFSLSSAKGTDPHDQVQFPILNSHKKCKLFLQDIFVTKAQLIVVPCTVFWQEKGLIWGRDRTVSRSESPTPVRAWHRGYNQNKAWQRTS